MKSHGVSTMTWIHKIKCKYSKKNNTVPLRGKQNGTVLRRPQYFGASIGSFTEHRKNGAKNGGTVFGGPSIQGAGIVFFITVTVLA